MFKDIYERRIGVGEILSMGWDIFISQFKPILFITLIIYIPINIILYFFNVSDWADFRRYMNVIKILEGFFGILATMGIAYIVQKATLTKEELTREEDEEISWGESLSKAFSCWGSCVGTNILGGIIIFGLMLLLIVPGIIWALYYSFAIQVVTLKGLSGKEALNYSKSLVKGQWWRVFGIFFLLNFINILIAVGVGFISGLLPDIVGILTDTIIDIIGAYFTVATTVFFLNNDSTSKAEIELEPLNVEL
jgi:hypothetical protein